MAPGWRRATTATALAASAVTMLACGRFDYDVKVTTDAGTPPGLAGWSSRDIGAATVPGATFASGDAIVVRGAGNGLCSTDEALRFFYTPVAATDVRLTAHFTTLQTTTDEAAVGVMMRDGLDPGARSVAGFKMAFVRLKHAVRATAGGPVTCGDINQPLPLWLRMTKVGDEFTIEYGNDGKAWSRLSRDAVHFDQVFAGVVVTSARADVLTSATFDGVTVEAGPF